MCKCGIASLSLFLKIDRIHYSMLDVRCLQSAEGGFISFFPIRSAVYQANYRNDDSGTVAKKGYKAGHVSSISIVCSNSNLFAQLCSQRVT